MRDEYQIAANTLNRVHRISYYRCKKYNSIKYKYAQLAVKEYNAFTCTK